MTEENLPGEAIHKPGPEGREDSEQKESLVKGPTVDSWDAIMAGVQ